MQASKHHRCITYKYTSQPHCTQVYNIYKKQNAITQIAVDGIKIWDIISDLWWNTFWVCEDEHKLRAVILYMLCITSTSVIQLNFTSISWTLTSCFGPTLQAVWLSDDKHKVEMYKEDITGGRGGGWEVDDKEKEEEIKEHKEGLRMKKRRINKMSKPLGCGQEVSLSAQISWVSVPDWRCHSADPWRTC